MTHQPTKQAAKDMARWRSMIEADLEAVSAVATIIHPDLPERIEVFARRLSIFPQGCRVLVSNAGIICGYAIAHPIVPYAPPKLDTMLGEIPPSATQFYIHDVAIDKRFRGGNFARTIIADLLQQADTYDSAALVSVYGTSAFWERFGFQLSDKDLSTTLAPYGAGAVFMTRPTAENAKQSK